MKIKQIRRMKIKRVLNVDGKSKDIQAILLKGEMTDAQMIDVAKAYGLTIRKIKERNIKYPHLKRTTLNILTLMLKNMLRTNDIMIKGLVEQIELDVE